MPGGGALGKRAPLTAAHAMRFALNLSSLLDGVRAISPTFPSRRPSHRRPRRARLEGVPHPFATEFQRRHPRAPSRSTPADRPLIRRPTDWLPARWTPACQEGARRRRDAAQQALLRNATTQVFVGRPSAREMKDPGPSPPSGRAGRPWWPAAVPALAQSPCFQGWRPAQSPARPRRARAPPCRGGRRSAP